MPANLPRATFTTWVLGAAAIGVIIVLASINPPTLPPVGNVSTGALEVSGVASLSQKSPGVVYFEPDALIRRNIDPADGGYQVATACLILPDAQMAQLREMGGKAHVRGRVTQLFGPDNCPTAFQSERSVSYAWAYRADRIAPLQPVMCSAAAFVMGGHKCDGRFLESGLPAPAADLDPQAFDVGKYYPEELVRRRIPAKVTVDYQIGRNGVEHCRVTMSSGIQAVDNIACRMVRKEPALWPRPRLNVLHNFQRTFSWDFEDGPAPTDAPRFGAIDLSKYYPADLLEAGVTGFSEVVYVLGPEGLVSCRPAASSGNPRLDAAACRLVADMVRMRSRTARQPTEFRQKVKWQIEDREASQPG